MDEVIKYSLNTLSFTNLMDVKQNVIMFFTVLLGPVNVVAYDTKGIVNVFLFYVILKQTWLGYLKSAIIYNSSF